MSSDAGEQIADAIVTYVNGRDYSYQFKAENPEDPERVLNLDGSENAHQGIQVVVVPVSEKRERFDGAAVNVLPVVNVFVSRYREEQITKKSLNAFTRELFQDIEFIEMAGYCWQETELVTKYDSAKLRLNDRFLSVFSLTYYGVA